MAVAGQVQREMALHPHYRYYVREVRVLAYSQVRDFTPLQNSPFLIRFKLFILETFSDLEDGGPLTVSALPDES